jgi:hypothetical protein
MKSTAPAGVPFEPLTFAVNEPTRVVLLDADGHLVGEAADRLARRRSEGQVREVL